MAAAPAGVASEGRKQFLSTLAPLAACVSAGAADAELYAPSATHQQPDLHSLHGVYRGQPGDRSSVASSCATAYSLGDIDEALDGTQPQPDLVAGTTTTATTTTEGGGVPSPGAVDELALFVQQDAGRIERLRRRYGGGGPGGGEDRDDDYGFQRRPSVRGIKPRFGSTSEIVSQPAMPVLREEELACCYRPRGGSQLLYASTGDLYQALPPPAASGAVFTPPSGSPPLTVAPHGHAHPHPHPHGRMVADPHHAYAAYHQPHHHHHQPHHHHHHPHAVPPPHPHHVLVQQPGAIFRPHRAPAGGPPPAPPPPPLVQMRLLSPGSGAGTPPPQQPLLPPAYDQPPPPDYYAAPGQQQQRLVRTVRLPYSPQLQGAQPLVLQVHLTAGRAGAGAVAGGAAGVGRSDSPQLHVQRASPTGAQLGVGVGLGVGVAPPPYMVATRGTQTLPPPRFTPPPPVHTTPASVPNVQKPPMPQQQQQQQQRGNNVGQKREPCTTGQNEVLV
ncbi:trithorax group protein osa-like [Schistocerca americana]|uniref:trithorax group protein osa-like n=1 Tax=Schistocerca americana TaxID=7009 RepID=UPI001F4F77FA|nr:trithorax group protein osa-like [Schistocerca americana]